MARLVPSFLSHPYWVRLQTIEDKEVRRCNFYTAKTDMWSLGCLLHEACTMKFPHHRVLLQLSLTPEKKPFDGDSSATVLANIIRLKRQEISTFYNAVIRKLVERLLKLEVSAGGYCCLRNNNVSSTNTARLQGRYWLRENLHTI